MTTIVYKDGVLAGDSKATIVERHAGSVRKVHKCSNGSLVAASGNLGQCQAFVKWVQSGCQEDRPSTDDIEALVITSDGTVERYTGDDQPATYEAPYYTIGTGAEVASGALEMGASAIEAVKIAAKLDINTGGPIQSVRL